MNTDESAESGRAIPREERVEQFGERFVEHSEWSAEERGRVREVVDDILAAVEDRDDVELAKTHTAISQTGKHDAGFDLKIAGEPWEYHDEDAEETVHKCGGCERVYGEPHVIDKGPRKAEVCPHCGTNVQNEDTEVRTVAF